MKKKINEGEKEKKGKGKRKREKEEIEGQKTWEIKGRGVHFRYPLAAF